MMNSAAFSADKLGRLREPWHHRERCDAAVRVCIYMPVIDRSLE